VGLSAIAYARLRGAGTLVAIGDPEARLELARAMGADVALSLAAESEGAREAAVRELTGGRGVDVGIECAGQPEAVAEGLSLLRDGGTYVIAGHYTDTGSTKLNPHTDINRKHADVRGSWGLEFGHLNRALLLLARHRDRLPFARVIGRRYRLEEAEQALADVESLSVTKAIITPQERATQGSR
jgi:L-iditol 2-dehydrogenase